MIFVAMHTDNACIRLVSILCVVVGCYSQSCDLGWTLSGELCQECIPGKYKSSTGTSACLDCPAFSNSLAASIALAACICNAGYSGGNGGTCTACDPAVYSPIVRGLTCQPEVNGQYTYVDQFGGGDRYRNSNGVFLFKPRAEWEHIFATATAVCPFHVTQCPFGYKVLGRTLGVVRNAGGIPQTISERCFLHGGSLYGGLSEYPNRENAFNPNLIACTCDLGWTLSSGGVCEQCTAGKYRSSIDNSICVQCPVSSNSLAASTALTACLCNAGYTGPDGGTCEACGFGVYKPTSGSAACIVCPASYEASVLTSAFSGSGEVTGCIEFL